MIPHRKYCPKLVSKKKGGVLLLGALLPKIISYSWYTVVHFLSCLNFLGHRAHFASTRHWNLIAEKVPFTVL
ncbi:unnamed protein product [Rotaria sordida]|uniref:Uncharacterized protein n=1 Tax=Rotaria sordida TaxID=392033 RepID=A0A813VW17_9BILA|nr:unnamed protein product [Rotaria sordida]